MLQGEPHNLFPRLHMFSRYSHQNIIQSLDRIMISKILFPVFFRLLNDFLPSEVE